MYKIVWNGLSGIIGNMEIQADLFAKPELGFAFEQIFYEEVSELYLKILNNMQLTLNAEEKAYCLVYVHEWLEKADFPVQAIEEETKIWQGTMLKSEAEQNGYLPLFVETPGFPVSRRGGEGWERIHAAITESGKLVLNPDANRQSFVLYYTEDERSKIPQPVSAAEVWDFKTKAWIDERSLGVVLEEAENITRMLYADTIKALLGNLDAAELYTWTIQREEASACQADQNAKTPFLDAMLAELSGMSKQELVASILLNYNEDAISGLGSLHGRMYKEIYAQRLTANKAEVDTLVRSMIADTSVTTSAKVMWNPLYTKDS